MTTTTTTTHCFQLDEDWAGYDQFKAVNPFKQVKHWRNPTNNYRAMRLEGDKLVLEASGNTSYNPMARLYSRFHIIGDFDVRLWCEDAYITDPAVVDCWAPMLVAHQVGGASQYVVVGRQWNWSPDSNGFSSYGNVTGEARYADALTSFGLRITRTGSVWKVYVWDSVAQQWEWNGSTAGRTMSETFTGAVYFQIRHDKGDDTYSRVDITKFQVYGGTCALGTDFTTTTTTTTTTTSHTTTTVSGNTTSTTTTLVYETDFSEYATGSPPSDWSHRWYGWPTFKDSDIKTALKSIGSQKYYINYTGGGAVTLESWDDVDNYKDVEILAQVRLVAANGPSAVMIWARCSGAYTAAYGYGVRIGNGEAGDPGLVSLCKMDNGTLYYLSHDTNFDHVSWAIRTTRRYMLRFRVRGHRIYAKVWDHGNPEPTEWMLKASDTTITTGGWIGYGAYGGNNTKGDIQFFNVATHGGTAQYPTGMNDRGQFTTTTSTTTSTTSTTTTVEVRDTQMPVEVLERDTSPEIRDTQMPVEVLERDTTPEIRTTQIVIEALIPLTTSTTSHYWEEDFEAMTIGQPPTGWTETWSTTGVDTSVEAAKKAKSLYLDKISNTKIAVTRDDGTGFATGELLALVRAMDAFSTFAGGVAARVSGGVGTEAGYLVYMDPANDKLKLRRYSGGVSTDLANGDYTVDADKWYWIRARFNGDNIKARMWPKHSAEGGTWLIDHTDTSPITAGGEWGVCTFNADMYCEHILFEGSSNAWPIPQPSYTTTTTTTTTTSASTTTTECVQPDCWLEDNFCSLRGWKWNTFTTGSGVTPYINPANGRLVLKNDGSDTVGSSYIELKEKLVGDFDLALTLYDKLDQGGNRNRVGFRLYIDGTHYARNYLYNRLDTRYYQAHGNTGTGDTYDRDNRSATWGHVRIRRVGSSITWGFDDGAISGWTSQYPAGSNIGSGDITLRIEAYNDTDNDNFEFEVDDLRLNSGSCPSNPFTTTSTTTTTTTTTSTTTSEDASQYSTNWSPYTSDVAPDDFTERWEPPVAALTVKDRCTAAAR